ncbi:MAG: DUF721 domain-containing protein [Thermoleophilia bacterium]|nr:DUF721 domain-containing protein [Thermoleophilia bacterium]
MDNDLDITNISSQLDRRFGRLGGGFGAVIAAWERVVGHQIARHAMPTSLREGILRVRCDDATWTSEIMHMGPTIARRLQDELGQKALSQLKAYTGRVGYVSERAEPAIAPLPPLDASTASELSSLARKIADPELRARVLRAMTACTARRRQSGVNTPESPV